MTLQPGRTPLQDAILSTLVYYDIWEHPLSQAELYAFLPSNSLSFGEFGRKLRDHGPGMEIGEHSGYYFLQNRGASVVNRRREKEQHAGRLWKMAHLATHIIKRFPYVRAVFVSGDLSKNVTGPGSDIDFFIITAPGKLWITRSMLVLFKKVFLLNSKKYFCLNSFATEDHLMLDEQNIFLATEVGHLKVLYNSEMFRKYLEQNLWIRTYFPNFDASCIPAIQANNRRSLLQLLFEVCLTVFPTDTLDRYLLNKMRRIWERRYPEFDEEMRARILRSTRNESRAYVGNFQDTILQIYRKKLKEVGLSN